MKIRPWNLHIIHNECRGMELTELDAVDRFCLLSFCDVHSDLETLVCAEVGTDVDSDALNNLCFIIYKTNFFITHHDHQKE